MDAVVYKSKKSVSKEDVKETSVKSDKTSDLGAPAASSTLQPDKTSDLGAHAGPSTLQKDKTSDLGEQAGPSTLQTDKTSDLGAHAGPSTLQKDKTTDLGAQAGPSIVQKDKTSHLGAHAGPSTLQKDKKSDLGAQAGLSILQPDKTSDLGAHAGPSTLQKDKTSDLGAQAGPSIVQKDKTSHLGAQACPSNLQTDITSDLGAQAGPSTLQSLALFELLGIADPRIFNPYNYRYHYPEVLGDPSTFVELPPVPAPPLTEQVIISVGVPGVETDKRVGKPVAVPDAPLTDQVEITVGVPRAAPPKSTMEITVVRDMPVTEHVKIPAVVPAKSETVLSVDAEHLNVVFLGDVGVGKTSIVARFCDGVFFNNYYKTTAGVDYRFRTLHLPDDVVVRLQIHDVAGREYYSDMPQTIYSNTNGAVIVFDESSTRDLSGVERWKKQLDDIVILPDGNPIPCILLGNKSDINSRLIDRRTLDNFVTTNNFLKFFRTSAKTGIGIYEAMVYLVEKMEVTAPIQSQYLSKEPRYLEYLRKRVKSSCSC